MQDAPVLATAELENSITEARSTQYIFQKYIKTALAMSL